MQQPFDAAAGRQLGMFFDEATIGPAEADLAIGGPLDAEPAFVHQPVVMTAEQNEILDRGVAAIRPVSDVMRIDETAMAAAREPASAVARRVHADAAAPVEPVGVMNFLLPITS